MTGDNKANGLAQGGQAPIPAPVEETPAQPVAEQLPQQPDIQAVLEQVLETRDETLRRWFQSQLDRREAHIWKRLGAQDVAVKKAKSLGISDEHLAALQEAGLLSATGLAEEADEDEPDEGDGVNAITAAGQELAATWGLTMADPETRMVVIDGTPAQYLQSIVQAGMAKQARTQQSAPAQPPAAQAVPAPASVSAARIPGVAVSGGGAPTNPIAHIKDRGELYKLAAQDMRAKRSKT